MSNKIIKITSNSAEIDRTRCKIMNVSNKPIFNWLRLVNLTLPEEMSYKEIWLLSELLKRYIKISETVSDDNQINQLLFSQSSRKTIKEEIGISDNYFDVLLNKLRNHKVIVDNTIVKSIIPPLNNKEFILLIAFKEDGKQKKGAA